MTGSLDQMAEEAANEVEVSEDGNSAEQTQTPVTPEATPSTQADATPAGEAKPTVEQAQPTAEQEAFTHIDPKTLPPELQPVYKSLQADYTRKRQAETAKIRDMEAKLAAQSQMATAQPEVPTQPGNQDFLANLGLTEAQLAKMSLPEFTAYVIEASKRGVQIETEQKSVESFENQAVTDFLSTDPRLNPHIESSFEPRMATWVGSEMDKLYQAHIDETGSPLGFDYRTNAQKLIGQWDGWMEEQLKLKVAKTTQNARQNAKSHLKSAPPGSQARSTTSSSPSLDDALEESLDELS